METPSISNSLLFVFLVTLSCSGPAYSSGPDDFLRCLSLHSQNYSAVSKIVYTPNNSSFLSIHQYSIRNLRFVSSSTPKPLVIVTPVHESQIQAVVLCSQENGMQIRTRSGGHDYEGLSCTSQVPFVVIDLINLSDVEINVERKTAWVQAGATLGQLYYRIAQKSRNLAFPGGVCPTVGVGGLFSGGGYGLLVRKYGLAADNIIDARLVDVNGRILNRKSMGEDLFWAIRGGGGGTFGVVTAWKLNLVSVPETVTTFSVNRTLQENATGLVHRWQYVAPNLPKDILLSIRLTILNSSKTEEKTIVATFIAVFLGPANKLLELLGESFPELGIKRDNCIEASWTAVALLISGFPVGASPKVLANRIPLTPVLNFKAKSDFVQEPIPENGLEGMWKLLYEQEAINSTVEILMIPYGGRMNEISESAVPFPHRAGNLYIIHYDILWEEGGVDASKRSISWIRGLYNYMAPYVSKFPRAAYVNYRDLDLGINNEGNTSYAQASVWGFKYFKNNFNRLVQIKTKVDPNNFFRHEQSIPPLYFQCTKNERIMNLWKITYHMDSIE